MSLDGGTVQTSALQSMVNSLHHRGPDNNGVHVRGCAGLGHTRLSILDLSESANQPMRSACGRYVIAYNGELYNFRELRRELEREGTRFKTSSDTEVVLNAFAAWGTGCFQRLNGMFALAIFDDCAQQLYLARDRFGIKPLYWFKDNRQVIFGSEIKAILAVLDERPAICGQALHEYLYFGTGLGGRSMYQGISQLLPGYFAVVKGDALESQRFADICDVERCNDDYATAVRRVSGLLDDAVRSHLQSDVPVGVFLSGGLDSAALVSRASRMYERKLSTYSAAFDFDGGHNELPLAREVADRYGTDHHEIYIQASDFREDAEALVRCHDEPFGDIANWPLYLMTKELNGSPKVVLQGDGGDEIFGGYHRYSRLSSERLFCLLAPVVMAARSMLPRRGKAYRALRTFHAFRFQDAAERMAWIMSQESPDLLPEPILGDLGRGFLEKTDPIRRYRELAVRLADWDAVTRMLFVDSSIILPDKYFEKVDRASMANSIEVRVPLVENQLADYVMSLPASYKATRGVTKRILRDVLKNDVPGSVLSGKKKGFGVPVDNWLRGSLAGYLKDVLFDRAIRESGLFDHEELGRRIDDHVGGRRNNGMLLYKSLMLGLWYREYML